ncbi:MAG: methyltransferase [Chitinispirillaceae bacterium]|nr:methyltransferase [Chitinispirillaceae bacterium]
MINSGNAAPYGAHVPSDEFIAEFAPLRPVDGCEGIVSHQAEDLFALWEAWETDAGGQCPTPFWAIAWPAAVVLARHILNNRGLVAGKTVLDLGCGGGLAGIAAARSGARAVIANDIDTVALDIARRNAAANTVRLEICPLNLAENPGAFRADTILVADLFYHRTASAALLEYLRREQKRGAEVIIADGNRPFTPATGITVLMQETVPVSMELEGVPHREVRLLSLEAV